MPDDIAKDLKILEPNSGPVDDCVPARNGWHVFSSSNWKYIHVYLAVEVMPCKVYKLRYCTGEQSRE